MRGAARRNLLFMAAAILVTSALVQSPAAERWVPASGPVSSEVRFVGVAGCAAMACHGGTRPNERNEYTTWIEHDRHARAFLVLYEDRALRIARLLGIEEPERETRCLVCHSTGVTAARGPKFAAADGVGCETCHGAAEKWLVPHARPEWGQKTPAEKYSSAGMTNTKDLVTRARICVKCHVGESGRQVDHDLIAAGHPPLIFELDAYTANMPPHWRETPDKPATFGAQAWAVGQAVGLRQSLELLADRAQHGPWPEFAEFECSSCHHELVGKSWRQDRGLSDRRAGSPLWSNPQLLLMLRWAASAETEQSGAAEYRALRRMLGEPSTPVSEIVAGADKAAAAAANLIERIAREPWDRNRLRRLLLDLAAESDAASLDYATAAHTTMALGAVFEAIARSDAESYAIDAQWTRTVRAILDRLYDEVRQSSLFDASVFNADLKKFRAAVQP